MKRVYVDVKFTLSLDIEDEDAIDEVVENLTFSADRPADNTNVEIVNTEVTSWFIEEDD